MWELYLLTRLGVIFPILVLILIFAAGVLLISTIDIAHDGVGEKNRMFFKRSAVTLAISVLGIIFIPTREDMLLIYGVGTTLDYLQDNEKVQQLPDKCVNALDAWVESLSEERR
jgi:hypothetical protein